MGFNDCLTGEECGLAKRPNFIRDLKGSRPASPLSIDSILGATRTHVPLLP
jgi:hypothetical protein